MSAHFLPYAQEQIYLMHPSITELVAEGSLARFVSEVLEDLDRDGTLASFYDQSVSRVFWWWLRVWR